jgi:ferritin-like metal-binding protein YciE
MKQETLKELFVEQIRDIYDAEKQLVKALPKLADAADSEELSDGLLNHLEETKGHVSRLEEVFAQVQIAPRGKTCKAMKGLIEEGNEASQEEEGALRDLAIIAGAQRVEHYEISAYGTARTLAEHLGLSQAARLLQQTEDEERAADTKLTEVATTLYESSDDMDDEGETASVGASRSGHSTSGKPGTKKKG